MNSGYILVCVYVDLGGEKYPADFISVYFCKLTKITNKRL